MSATLSLSLNRLLPLPLRDRLASRTSALWQQDVSWNGAGDRIFVQAPSGTGKTTLIHILYGLRADYDGRVVWGCKPLHDTGAEPLSTLRRETVSIIFQDMRLFPALTAWENLEIKRLLTNSVTADEVRAWMDMLGIADRADRPAGTLSYGEQQRVAVIRALLQPFQWLLMDEPFSHLDKANAARAAHLIDDVVGRNRASFLLVDLDDNAHFGYTQKLML
jgi:putative ABC transport system ATP-binding protein